jgi:hypothetical protein
MRAAHALTRAKEGVSSLELIELPAVASAGFPSQAAGSDSGAAGQSTRQPS